MKIVLKCSCGKVLRLPMDYAGKYGKCPQCGKENIVPKLTEEESSPQINISSCPTCGAYLSDADEVCVSCRTNLKTGEWKANEIQSIPRCSSLPRIPLAVALSYIILCGIIVFLWFKPSIKSQLISFYLEYNQLPENTELELKTKIARWQNFKENVLPEWSDIEKSNAKTQQKLFDFQYKEHLKHFMEVNKEYPSLESIVNLVKLQFSHHTKIKWDPEIEKHIQFFLNSYSVKVDQLSQEQRYKEIVTRITPSLLQEIFSAFFTWNETSATVKASVNSLISQYKNDGNPNLTVMDRTEGKKKLQEYQKSFELYEKKFYETILKRDYEEAEKNLEKYWNNINSLSYFESESDFVKDIRQKLNDLQSINSLIMMAKEGALHSQGHKRKFELQNGDKIIGTVEKYSAQTFYVKTENSKLKKFHLMDLSAMGITLLAVSTNKRNYSTYLYASVFLAYEQLYDRAFGALGVASENGASPQEISFYKEWIEKIKLERKK